MKYQGLTILNADTRIISCPSAEITLLPNNAHLGGILPFSINGK